MDAGRLQQAIDLAIANETSAPRDLEEAHYETSFAREPYGFGVGPFKERGPMTGMVVVARWIGGGIDDFLAGVIGSIEETEGAGGGRERRSSPRPARRREADPSIEADP